MRSSAYERAPVHPFVMRARGYYRNLRGDQLSPSARILATADKFDALSADRPYRQGLPREADLVFDVRFLKNPHYDPALRPLTGRDPEIGRFIESDPAYAAFFAALTALLQPLLPCFEREGKSYVTIAIGCTGGRHRSVFVAERLAAWLAAQDRMVGVRHRDAVGLAIDES